MSTLSVGSCFAGIGGLDLGFERTGHFTTEWHSEVNGPALRVLRHRFPNAEACGDIRALTDGFFLPDAVDVLAGGPPCQGISKANAYARSGLADARSQLFFAYAELVERLAPTWLVMEQVVSLLTSSQGNDYRTVLSTFEGMGYDTAVVAHNSLAYVPQYRARLVFVGCRKPGAAARALLPAREDGASDPHAYNANAWRSTGRTRPVAPHVFRKSRRPRSDTDGETWVEASYVNTLTVHDVGRSRATVIAIDNDGRPRTLTPVEWERCHGFPDDWTAAAGSDNDRGVLLGNAVTVPLAERIAEGIVEVESL